MNLKKLKSEDNFIIHACSLNEQEALEALNYISDSFDWEYYWDEVNRNGVGGILYKKFKRKSDFNRAVPEYIYKLHKQFYFQSLTSNIRKFNAFSNEIGFLKKQGINDIIVIKGGYLLPEVYQDLGIRPMSDFDIIVPDWNTIELISKLLIEKRGFNKKVYKRKWQEDYRKKLKGKPAELYKSELVVELHPPSYFQETEVNNPFVLNKIEHFIFNEIKIRTLNTTQHLEVLVDHYKKHAVRGAHSLRMILEILMFYGDKMCSKKNMKYYFQMGLPQMGTTFDLKTHNIWLEIKQLIRHRFLFRYILSTLFPSKQFLSYSFAGGQNSYFVLYFIYIFDFLKRLKR